MNIKVVLSIDQGYIKSNS